MRRATRIDVQLIYEAARVSLRVEDDGRGFDPQANGAARATMASGACRSGQARSMPRWCSKAHPARVRGSRSRRRWDESREKVGSMSDPIRIMIVEDHAMVRQGLAALLRTVPDFSIVAEAADGREAIELFRRISRTSR